MFANWYHSWQIAESMTSAAAAQRTARAAQTNVDSLQRRIARLEG